MMTLIDAAKSGNYKVVLSTLRSNGPESINDRESEMKGTALFWAANGGHRDIVQVLLDWGADMEIPVKWGMTPLLAAVDRKHYRTAQLLLVKGANVNVQSQKGDTALHIAAYRGSSQLCKLLVAYAASRRTLNNNGKTAQQEAAGAGHMNLTKILAPESSQRPAVFRTSSLPLEYRQEGSNHLEEWEDSRVPSENDETIPPTAPPAATRTSLRRKILKSALPSSASLGGEGDLQRSHSETSLSSTGNVSPPPVLQGSPPRQQIPSDPHHPGYHPGSSSGYRPGSPSGHRPGSPSTHRPGSPSGHRPGSPSGHRPGSPSGYGPDVTGGHRRGSTERVHFGCPSEYRLGSSFGFQHGNPSGPPDQQHQLMGSSRSSHVHLGNSSGHHSEHPLRFQQASLADHLHRNALAYRPDSPPTDPFRNGADRRSSAGYDLSSRHNPDGYFLRSPAAKQRKDAVKETMKDPNRFFHDIGQTSNIHSQKVPRVQNVSPHDTTLTKDPSDSTDRELFPGIERLLSIIERLESEKNSLTKQNKGLEKKLQTLQTLVDGFATDSSSEESWQAYHGSQNTSFHQTLVGELESEKQRRADLESLCGKLVTENCRLKSILNSPGGPNIDTKEGLLSEVRSPQGHMDGQQMETVSQMNDSDVSHASCSSVPVQSPLINLSGGSPQSFHPRQFELPPSSNHSCQRGQQLPMSAVRRCFAVECWHSLNSTYLRPANPNPFGTVIGDAMGKGNSKAGSRKMIYQHIKMLLQVYGSMPENWSSVPGGHMLEKVEMGPECNMFLQEKMEQDVSGDNGAVFACFQTLIDSKPCVMKVHYSLLEKNSDERPMPFQVEDELSGDPHLHLPISRWEIDPGAVGDSKRELLISALKMDHEGFQVEPSNIHMNLGGAGLTQRVGKIRCRIYPGYQLSLGELFDWVVKAADSSPDRLAVALPGDACLLRILLQLLRAVDSLQRGGVLHGNISPRCVYVTEDMRIVLGGLNHARCLKSVGTTPSVQGADTSSNQCVANLQTQQMGMQGQGSVDKDAPSWRNKDSPSRLHEESLDACAVATMLCGLASSADSSDGEMSSEDSSGLQLPDTNGHPPVHAPDWLSPGLKHLLSDMTSPDPENRPSVKTALLRASMLLYWPLEGDIQDESDCEEWLTAQAFRLLMNTPPDNNTLPSPAGARCRDAVARLDWFMCRDFILAVAPRQLWQLYQTSRPAPASSNTSSKGL